MYWSSMYKHVNFNFQLAKNLTLLQNFNVWKASKSLLSIARADNKGYWRNILTFIDFNFL